MCNNLNPILIDTHLKVAWLKSLSVASSIILSGGELPSEVQRESVGLYLLDIMNFIATEVEEELSEKVVALYSANHKTGGGHE
ncbi:hypothetical protein [Nitrosomonas marina]|uniref:Uncharacterized protein n=1 Tax=Nitrosomonas marina TaxID=917 RepID=A0A1H8FXV7_9PROT|nr:hypothetical protein [Nitrosomonas marina]SEN35918.1 hypothetical protein SAMN05216325_11511 [Nitrosomonas marina]